MNIRFYHAKILLSEAGHAVSILEGELWVRGTRICYIGECADSCKIFPKDGPIIWDREIDVNGNLLMPGFKNAHTHTAMTFLRSDADDLPLSEWLNCKVFPKEERLKKGDIYWLARLGILEYLTGGITAGFDMYLSPQEMAKAAADSGFRMVLTSGFNDFVSSPEQMEEDFYAVNEMSSLTSFVTGFHAEYTTSLQNMERVAALAQKLHSPVWLHNSETRQEVEECIARYGKTPTQLTDELGMYGYGGGGYHCIWLSEEDMAVFQNRKLYAVTNPASNLKLASGICPAEQLLACGIPMAIGTDGPASNNCLDMFREMFLTAVLPKLLSMDASSMDALLVLSMAVSGGAKAMGLSECDCLAVGKKADLILIDLNQPNMQPENHILKNLVYSGSKQNVKMTMVDGKILYEEKTFHIDVSPEEIYQKANEVTRRVRGGT